MDNVEIIESLKTIIKCSFKKELVNDDISSLTSITPSDVFERWWNTTVRICQKDNNLISTLCKRASQAGYPCYPVGYIDKKDLKDDEIKLVKFINVMEV